MSARSHAICLCLCCLCGLLPSSAFAQLTPQGFQGQTADPTLIYLLQGERRQLSEDLVAELDGDKLLVSLKTSGLLRQVPREELLVSLVQPNGVKEELRPDGNGELVFSNVRRGLAAMVVTADRLAGTSLASTYAAIPFYVTAPAGNARPPRSLQVPVTEVNPESLVTELNQSAEPPSSEQEILADASFETVPSSRFRVQRLADNSIQGRLVVPQRGYEALPGVSQLTLYRGGTRVAAATSAADGSFVVPNVPLGLNGLVVTGRSGHVAYSVDVVPFQAGPAITRNGANEEKFVTKRSQPVLPVARQAGNSGLSVLLIPPALMDEVRQIVNDRLGGGVPPFNPLAAGGAGAGGGFGSGFAGGGAGGGGGGGFGGGAAFAGLAGLAGLAALSGDDSFAPNLATSIAPP